MSEQANQETRLRVVQTTVAEAQNVELTLGPEPQFIGRDPSCDLTVADKSMSRRHASVWLAADGRVMVRDNKSSNGVFVEGHRVAELAVANGQKLTMGGTTFIVDMPAAEPEEAIDLDATALNEVSVDRTVQISNFAEVAQQFEKPRALEELGQGEVTTANRPFLISDASTMWILEEGKIEIFTVNIKNGEPVGARTHFVTVEPGEAFFGLESDYLGFDSGFLAVGKAGSELVRMDIEQLERFAPVPEHKKRIAGFVSQWVTSLSKRLVSDLPKIPRAEIALRPGETTLIEPEKVTAPGTEVLWIEMPAARFLFDSMGSLSWEVEGVLFPLAPSSWIELLASDTPIEFTPYRTEEVIGDPRLWAGLQAFHRTFMECEFINKRLAVVDEFNRLQRKAERADAARDAGIGAIESVLAGTGVWRLPNFGSDVGPVFDCCAAIAQYLGIEVKRPVGDLEDLSFEDTVLAVATASRFRVRRISLVDNWWDLDQGPLLAQREESNAPVALVPKGRRGGYTLIDPATNERETLTEDMAEGLIPFAYSFYRRFPDGVLGARDLIRFGTYGLRPEFREVALMGIATGLLGTVVPAITGQVFDSAIPQAERAFLWQLCLGLFMVALSTSAFKIVQNMAMLRVQSKMDYSVQAAVWDRLLDLPMTFFREYSAGDLADRASAVDKIRSIIAGAGIGAILGSFASLFNAIQMAFYSLALAGVAIGLTLIYVSLTTLCNYLKLRLQRTEFHRRGMITGLVLQLISGVGKLRVSGTEDHAFKAWATEFAGMRRTGFAVGRIGNFMPVLNAGFPVLSSMAIFFTMAKLQQSALEKGEVFDLTTGDFLAFSSAYGIFLAAMQALGDVSVSMLGVVPIFERLKPLLEEESEIDASKAAPAALRGKIELSNLSFRYTEDGPLVLKNINLEIEPGQFVAFVGGSGSGKSTMMKVMLGFLSPESGSVYYDGMDLSTLDVRMVRQQLGVVLQESRLLPADIYRNIVGSSSKTVADAWDAARKAGLSDDIKRLPMGMHTYVSEGGGGFSGGQKQRLMIARALVHNPRILYLDEATSALDNRTQAIVTQSMDRLNATRIVIAHRLSTVVNADIICYLEDGELKEKGSFEELKALGGAFAELAARQEA